MQVLPDLIANLKSANPTTAEPAARTLRKQAERNPATLARYKKDLLKLAFNAQDLRVRWNLIAILGKLSLTPSQRATAADWLFERLADASPFTRTFALQALFDLSSEDPPLRNRVLSIAHDFAENGTAAMQARAKKLLLARKRLARAAVTS
jgi:hypothetical protein